MAAAAEGPQEAPPQGGGGDAGQGGGSDAPPTQVYRFEHLKYGKELGKGSHGIVRLCKHQRSGELFAMRISMFGPQMNVHGLQQELGQVAQMCPHPNLVRYFDAYFREGCMFILMEYMHHGSLADLLDQGGPERKGRPHLQIPDLELSHIMSQVIDGLNSLHSRNIIHRDLRPSHILANTKGVIKIGDLAVSRVLNEQAMSSQVGRRAYLSPERVRGEWYNKSADVWTLGVCCAELAMGDFPWRHLTVFNLCDMLQENKARVEWGSHPAGEQLRDFVGACMEQEASDRASCNQLRDHDFIVKYTAQPVDLAEYLEKIHDRPSPWRARRDAKGRIFYHNRETGQKQWERPAGFEDQASEETERRRQLLNSVYAAAGCVACSLESRMAEHAARYAKLQPLHHGLLALQSGSLLLRSAAPESASPGGVAFPRGEADAELGWEGGAGGGAHSRQADGLGAQQSAEGAALSVFSRRAQEEANRAYPPTDLSELQPGGLVQAAGAFQFDVLAPGEVAVQTGAAVSIGEDGDDRAVPCILARGDGEQVSLPEQHLLPAPTPQMLRWARDFPERWRKETDIDEFRAEDIACPLQWKHASRRPVGKRDLCCLQRSLGFVTGRLLKPWTRETTWVDRMAQYAADCGSLAVQEGIAATHIFCLELMDPRTKRPRKSQIYAVLNAAMRKNWAEQMKVDSEAARTLRRFAPLIWHLHGFTNGMGTLVDHVIVYRGIDAIVAQGYRTGTTFVWGCFSSTAEKATVAENFSAGVGTLFVLRERRAVPISICSMYPSEAERVLLPTTFRVLSRMPETTLAVAETRSDIVIAEEVRPSAGLGWRLLATAAGTSGLGPGVAACVRAAAEVEGVPVYEHCLESLLRRLSPPQEDTAAEAEAAVQLRLKAHSKAAFIFKMFFGRFVEPRLQVDGVTTTRLFAHFDGAGQRDRVTLLRGDGGTGKTSVLLAVLSYMLARPPDKCQEAPIFVHCPWAEGLLTSEDFAGHPRGDASSEIIVAPIVHALCCALCINTPAELAALQKQPMIVLLDSLDECATCDELDPGALLRKERLLPRGGVLAERWPNTRFIICCRKEFLITHDITPQMLDSDKVTVCDIQPFDADEQSQYVTKLVKQEVDLLEVRLAQGEQDPTSGMHCVPCSLDAAEKLGQAKQLVKQAGQTGNGAADSEQAAGAGSTPGAPGSCEGLTIGEAACTAGGAAAWLAYKLNRAAAEQAAKENLAEAKANAEKQCADGVRAVLKALPSGLVANPFVLFLACSASRQLASADLSIAPRYKIYATWARQDLSDRIVRCPELASVMPAAPDRIDRLMDAASSLAVGMCSRRVWQTRVGECVRMLGGGSAARAVLSVLPLRLESAERDECRVTWRHKTVQEFAIARALLLPGRTSAAVWDAALTGPINNSPEVQAFVAEGRQTLSETEAELLQTALSTASGGTDNANTIAELCGFKQQQSRSSEAQSEAETAELSPTELQKQNAALRQTVSEQQSIVDHAVKGKQAALEGQNAAMEKAARVTEALQEQSERIAVQQAELERLRALLATHSAADSGGVDAPPAGSEQVQVNRADAAAQGSAQGVPS